MSHRNAGADVRDHVAFTPESAAAFRERLAAAGIDQSMVLSTCNRCEVFVWVNGQDARSPGGGAGTNGQDARSPGEGAFGRTGVSPVQRLFKAEFPDVGLDGILETRTGVDALTYLFRIAAGLESMVLGEYQILGQVKDAHAASLASGHAGKELDRILRDAVTAAKRVKTELDIGAVPPSVCRSGMEHVDRIAGLAGKRVFVIGSGRTGTLAAKFAKRHGAKTIAVCNRSPERAQKLVEEIGATVVDYASRSATIAESDIVVSATASPHVVVKADQLKLSHPVVFLDLASPRDVEPSVAANPLVTLVSIDTIGELAAGDRLERERLTAKGMSIIVGAVRETTAWLDSGERASRPFGTGKMPVLQGKDIS